LLIALSSQRIEPPGIPGRFIPNKWTSLDRNWKLLEDTCAAIRNKYGDRIKILVDKDGLVPGQDWNHHLNLWLSECHVALIIFSTRAVEKSDWVAKEATILSWRADLDKAFILIPITMKDEISCDKLSEGYLGTIRIAVSQCIRDIENAEQIVDGLMQALGGPAELAIEFPKTPVEVLQGGIEKLLSDQTSRGSIISTLESLECEIPADGNQNTSRFAGILARELFSSRAKADTRCFRVFETSLNTLAPPPAKESAEYLFGLIRSLWVDAGAAGRFPKALQHNDMLLMTGFLANLEDSILKTRCYTLERCIERAFPSSSKHCIVTVTHDTSLDQIKQGVQDEVLGKGFPPQIPEATRLAEINRSGTIIFLVITTLADNGGLPDPRALDGIQGLNNLYDNIVIVFSIAETPQTIPGDLVRIEPTADPELETSAYTTERASRQFINRKYPD
jgi:hypothetical protein